MRMNFEEKEMHRLEALKEIAELLNEATNLQDMLEKVLHTLLQVMNLQTGWIFFIDESGKHSMLVDENLPEALTWQEKKPMCEGNCWCVERFVNGRLEKATNIIECKRIEDAIECNWGETEDVTHHATIPLRSGSEKFGLLNVAAPHKTHFSEEELALLESIAFQIGTTIQRIQLVEKERKYVVVAERNRLARDLHDSVKQLLFSIMLTAKGTLNMTQDRELQEMLSYIGELSQEALQEMTLLIWQLRPEGLEKGLAEAIQNYGKLLGVQVEVRIDGMVSIGDEIEEVLWRISQEALHNCKKHASCEKVHVLLKIENNQLHFYIEDNGIGFIQEQVRESALGLKSMKERIQLMKGRIRLKIKLLLVEDHHIVRRGLVFFLKTREEFEIIGEAENGEEALHFVQKERPDVVLMDVSMPKMAGIEATKRLKQYDETIKVLILSSFSEQDYVIPALEAGADGYQLKEVQPEQLVASIIAVHQGNANFHPKVTPALMGRTAVKKEIENPFSMLTKREQEVLREIAKGRSNKEIAAELHITEQTVKTHVSNVLAKLEVDDRTQAALYAVKHGEDYS